MCEYNAFQNTFEVGKILNVLKENPYAHKGCIYLIKIQ